jgi:hypothetical protein
MIEESLPSESIILRFDWDLRTNCALMAYGSSESCVEVSKKL